MSTTVINCENLDFEELGRRMRSVSGDVELENCLGQRFIASGRTCGCVTIDGIPGNALGAYLDGAELYVRGNAQDAVGDTMNAGKIVVDGSIGDAPGYAMRGGSIYIRGDAGWRAGIHMKAYRDRQPAIVIGGCAGNFLGEYQAGGIIIVLGLGCGGSPVGEFCGTGMHGGMIVVRADAAPEGIPSHVAAQEPSDEDMKLIMPHILEFCRLFEIDKDDIFNKKFHVLKPKVADPYKQLYTRS